MTANILLLLKEYGLWGMLVLCFAEASFLPVPPELLFVPLCLAQPGKAIGYALLATLATVSGAFFGYVLGKVFGHPLLHRFVSAPRVAWVENLFHRYGVWVIFLAGIAPPPTPFKIFTISAGIFALNPPRFLLAALFGRGIRYLIEASLIWRGGKESLGFLKEYSGWISLVLALLLFAAFVIYQRRFQKKQVAGEGLARFFPESWKKFLAGEGKLLKTIGEWSIALGSAAFLTFFLADIVKDTGLRQLHETDLWAAQWLKPHLGNVWAWLGRGFGPGLLSLVLLATSVWWHLKDQKDRILFLLINLFGASLVLLGFDRIILESYRMTGGPHAVPMALVNTLWASYVLWMVTGGRPSFRGRRFMTQVAGFVFLILLAVSRIGAGYLLSEVLLAYATAGLWLVVVWIIFLYREAEHDNT